MAARATATRPTAAGATGAAGAAADAAAAAAAAVAYAPAGVTVSTFALKARDGDAVESPDAPAGAAGGRKKFKKHHGAKIRLGRVTDDDGEAMRGRHVRRRG